MSIKAGNDDAPWHCDTPGCPYALCAKCMSIAEDHFPRPLVVRASGSRTVVRTRPSQTAGTGITRLSDDGALRVACRTTDATGAEWYRVVGGGWVRARAVRPVAPSELPPEDDGALSLAECIGRIADAIGQGDEPTPIDTDGTSSAGAGEGSADGGAHTPSIRKLCFAAADMRLLLNSSSPSAEAAGAALRGATTALDELTSLLPARFTPAAARKLGADGGAMPAAMRCAADSILILRAVCVAKVSPQSQRETCGFSAEIAQAALARGQAIFIAEKVAALLPWMCRFLDHIAHDDDLAQVSADCAGRDNGAAGSVTPGADDFVRPIELRLCRLLAAVSTGLHFIGAAVPACGGSHFAVACRSIPRLLSSGSVLRASVPLSAAFVGLCRRVLTATPAAQRAGLVPKLFDADALETAVGLFKRRPDAAAMADAAGMIDAVMSAGPAATRAAGGLHGALAGAAMDAAAAGGSPPTELLQAWCCVVHAIQKPKAKTGSNPVFCAARIVLKDTPVAVSVCCACVVDAPSAVVFGDESQSLSTTAPCAVCSADGTGVPCDPAVEQWLGTRMIAHPHEAPLLAAIASAYTLGEPLPLRALLAVASVMAVKEYQQRLPPAVWAVATVALLGCADNNPYAAAVRRSSHAVAGLWSKRADSVATDDAGASTPPAQTLLASSDIDTGASHAMAGLSGGSAAWPASQQQLASPGGSHHSDQYPLADGGSSAAAALADVVQRLDLGD